MYSSIPVRSLIFVEHGDAAYETFSPQLQFTDSGKFDGLVSTYYADGVAEGEDRSEPLRPVQPLQSSEHSWSRFVTLRKAWRASRELAAYDDKLRRWCQKTGRPFVPRPALDDDIPPVPRGALSNVCHFTCAVSMLVVVVGLSFWVSVRSALDSRNVPSSLRSSASFRLLLALCERSSVIFSAIASSSASTLARRVGRAYGRDVADLHGILLAACDEHSDVLQKQRCEPRDKLPISLTTGTIADVAESTRGIALLVRASLNVLSSLDVTGLPALPRGVGDYADLADSPDTLLDEASGLHTSVAQNGGFVRIPSAPLTDVTPEYMARSLSNATPEGQTPAIVAYYMRDHFVTLTRVSDADDNFIMLVDNDFVLTTIEMSNWLLGVGLPVLVGFLTPEAITDRASNYAPTVLPSRSPRDSCDVSAPDLSPVDALPTTLATASVEVDALCTNEARSSAQAVVVLRPAADGEFDMCSR